MGSCSALAFMSLAFFAFQACSSYELSDGSTFQFSHRHFESLRIQKRSDNTPSQQTWECCGTHNETQVSMEQAVQKKCSHFLSCAKSIKSTISDEKAFELSDCFAICMDKELGMIKKGKLQEEAKKRYFSGFFNEREVNELSRQVIDYCLKAATENLHHNSVTCDPLPGVLWSCHFRLMMMNCPKKYADQSKECQDVKEAMEKMNKKEE